MNDYPEIHSTALEARRHEMLKTLGRAFQSEMDKQGNPCALKGGTALRFQIGLPRPSTDLDFEGDKRINVRRAIVGATAAAFVDTRYRIGINWLFRGAVEVRIWDQKEKEWLPTKIDYRRTGTMPTMPAKVPLDKCERLHGMNIYNDTELVRRKLPTVIGLNPRRKARDIYDAGWLVTTHPALISVEDSTKLKAWIENMSPERQRRLMNRLDNDRIIGRVNADTIWERLESGIRAL